MGGGKAFPVPMPVGVRNVSAVIAEIKKQQPDGLFIASNKVLQGADLIKAVKEANLPFKVGVDSYSKVGGRARVHPGRRLHGALQTRRGRHQNHPPSCAQCPPPSRPLPQITIINGDSKLLNPTVPRTPSHPSQTPHNRHTHTHITYTHS